MENMDWGEALALASQMKNHYRAFAKLEEMLQTIVSSQQNIEEKTRLREALEQQVQDLRDDIAALSKTKGEEELALVHLQRACTAEAASFKDAVLQCKKDADKEKDRIADDLVLLHKKFDDDFNALNEKHASLLKAIQGAEDKLAAVKTKIDSIRRSL